MMLIDTDILKEISVEWGDYKKRLINLERENIELKKQLKDTDDRLEIVEKEHNELKELVKYSTYASDVRMKTLESEVKTFKVLFIKQSIDSAIKDRYSLSAILPKLCDTEREMIELCKLLKFMSYRHENKGITKTYYVKNLYPGLIGAFSPFNSRKTFSENLYSGKFRRDDDTELYLKSLFGEYLKMIS